MMFYDVAIVGAGPAGTMTAKHLALRGLSTVILEEHKAIGFPVQCAGLLGKKALSSCEVSERCVLKKITGANIFGPEGDKLSIGGGNVRAYVVDRRVLDTEMAKNAIEAGSDILLNFHVS
jgi:flavin-dependent dehydrogenase